MYQYVISTGEFLHEWQHVAFGYSGTPEAKNDPEKCNVPEVGPIPPGTYRIGPVQDHPKLGPCAMPLEPIEGTDTLGRSGFFMHGDSISHPGTASHGCVILNRIVRSSVAENLKTDDLLRVVPRSQDEMQSLPVSD